MNMKNLVDFSNSVLTLCIYICVFVYLISYLVMVIFVVELYSKPQQAIRQYDQQFHKHCQCWRQTTNQNLLQSQHLIQCLFA